MTTLVKSSGPHVLGRAESEILITCQNRRGMDVRAIPLRISRHSATFEVYNPYSVVQVAEVLRNLNIYVDGYSVYAGRGVVTHLMNTGLLVICEVLLEDAWQSTSAAPAVIWQRLQKLFLEYPAGSGTVSSQFTDALDRLGGYLDAGCVALGGNSTRVGSQSLPSNPPTPERVREAMDDLGAAL